MYEVYGGTLRENICITIDGRKIFCKEGTSILNAAQQAGIYIPTLCYMKGLTPTGACGICAVELVKDGKRVIRHACRYRAKDGMEIYTDTPAVAAYRTAKMEDILKYHPGDCFFCPKNAGNCRLQEMAKMLDIKGERLGSGIRGIDDSNPAIIRDMDKCIGCGRCLRVCRDVQKIDVFAYFKDQTGHRYVSTKNNVKLSETNCISCGQCVKVCPVGALVENRSVLKACEVLSDPSKTIVWQIDPAVPITIGEEFGRPPGYDVTKELTAALRKLGGYVYNADFSGDVATMEEGTEFINRLDKNGILPMITSGCSGWVQHMEYNYPELLNHLSSCKSTGQMGGALIKTYLPEKLGVKPEDIWHISVVSCIAAKYELQREEMRDSDGRQSVDMVLTVPELVKLLNMRGINLMEIVKEEFDPHMSESTGAADLHAVTGGVTESMLRMLSVMLTDGRMNDVDYKEVRGFKGIKEITVKIADLELKAAVVNGIGNAGSIMDEIAAGKSPYHLVEVMACPGGCINGGGTPAKMGYAGKRADGIYELDKYKPVRRSHENEEVKILYQDFLGEPCGQESYTLLHTNYVDRSGKAE